MTLNLSRSKQSHNSFMPQCTRVLCPAYPRPRQSVLMMPEGSNAPILCYAPCERIPCTRTQSTAVLLPRVMDLMALIETVKTCGIRRAAAASAPVVDGHGMWYLVTIMLVLSLAQVR